MTTVEQQMPATDAAIAPLVQWEPQVIAFVCSWCSLTAVDSVGASGIQYPANIRLVRVPCAGRLNPLFVIRSLRQGIDGVWIVGCEPGHCHYRSGNLLAQRRFRLLKGLLEHIGVEPERLRLSWIGASGGLAFARLAGDVVERIRALGPAQTLVHSQRHARVHVRTE